MNKCNNKLTYADILLLLEVMKIEELSEVLKALSDPTRLRILKLLPPDKDCKEVYNVTELVEELKLPQSTVSHNLRILYKAGLLKKEKMCRDVYYWIDRKAVERMLGCLKYKFIGTQGR